MRSYIVCLYFICVEGGSGKEAMPDRRLEYSSMEDGDGNIINFLPYLYIYNIYNDVNKIVNTYNHHHIYISYLQLSCCLGVVTEIPMLSSKIDAWLKDETIQSYSAFFLQLDDTIRWLKYKALWILENEWYTWHIQLLSLSIYS